MASLEKLTIRGIRNFGTDTGDEQKITFSSPLTLIIGSNGCGKTTIIESIKYALTGEMPPNCKDGKSFINNPELSNLNEALGQVRLRFKTSSNSSITICRSAKVSKKNQKYTFKTLDAAITVEKDGKELQLNKRNNDATDDMCAAMGVSRAIINNVLFCHQEDASWPMSTDNELMQRFDKIFGTSEYNNALDKMRAMRKQYESDVKDKKIDLNTLEMNKQRADEMNLEIRKHQDETARLNEQIQECGKDLDPLREEMKKVEETEKQFSNITKSKTEAETELKNAQRNEANAMEKITEIFNGTKEELITKIEQFNDEHISMTGELTEEQAKLGVSVEKQKKISNQEMEYTNKYHTLIKDREHEQELYSKRAELIKTLCTGLAIRVDFDIENDNNRAGELIPEIKRKIDIEKNKIAEMVENNEKIDKEQEREIGDLREKEVSINSETKSIQSQLNGLNEELKKQNELIKEAEKSSEMLRQIEEQLIVITSRSESYEKSIPIDKLEIDVENNRKEREKLNGEIENLDEQIQEINSFAGILADIKSREKNMEIREAEERRIRNKHHESLKRIFPDKVIESNFKRTIDQEGQKQRSELNRLEGKLKLRENSLIQLKNDLRNKKQQKTDAEAERNRLEDEIERLCESEPFEEVLAQAREETEKFKMEYSSLKSSEMFYKKYIKKVEDQPCCPLCHKDLNVNDITGLKNELQDEIVKLPENISLAEEKHKMWSTKLEKLIGLKPKVERFHELQNDLIPLYQKEYADIEAKSKQTQDDIKKITMEITEPREKYELINGMLGDVGILDDIIKENERNKREIEILRQSLPGDQDGAVNLDELNQIRKTKNDRFKKLDAEITETEARIRRYREELRKLKDRKMEILQKKLNIEGTASNLPMKKAAANELNTKITDLKKKIETNNKALEPVKQKIQEAEKRRQQTKSSNSAKLRAENVRLENITQTFSSMDGTTKDLERIARKNLQAELDRIREKIRLITKEKDQQTKTVDEIREKIKNYTERIAKHQMAERNLKDNMDLMEIREEIEKKQKQLDRIKKDERELNTEQLIKKKAELKEEMNKLITKQLDYKGRISAKAEEIKKLENDLNVPKYRDARLNYQKALYENIVTQKIVEDLNTYCEVLERALTKFHGEKMAKINRLIRELWRSIYKGNDIDYIQINTEEVKGTSKRRSYTYRIVASKNDSFMDFRGQSSAGQRVLACLIIRIALAETFSGTCGVLALDEPTTNLDRLNIESLCQALNRLVEERESQRNFMLIIITHDQDFIETMDRAPSYWKVYRDDNGKSRTEKLRLR